MDDLQETEQTKISPSELNIAADAGFWSANEALNAIDSIWYNRTSQLGRWMDIIGDYAGDELFLLNGDSLMSIVLDDPLLALGRKNDLSFQFLHARYSLERALKEYVKRNAVFEIVFFEDQRHATYHTGASDFVVASRCLARRLLKLSLLKLSVSIPVHTFQDLDDPEWHIFSLKRKPMFVMTDDGGPVKNDTNLIDAELQASRALIQRTFIYDLLNNGIAISLMRGAEFKDSKIFSFIYEQRRTDKARDRLDSRIWEARNTASASLNAKHTLRDPLSSNGTNWMIIAAREFLFSVEAEDVLARPLLYIFICHKVALDTIPISLRAQPAPDSHPKLDNYLRGKFYPRLFSCLERSQTLPSCDIDLDGRIFLYLIQALISHSAEHKAISELLGPELASDVATMWKEVDPGNPEADLSPLFSFAVARLSRHRIDHKVLTVLPFSHPVLDEHLAVVHVHADPSSSISDEPGKFDIDSGLGTLFKDNLHWHNPKRAILPKHLGGEHIKLSTLGAKTRFRMLRRDQHFQAGLQRQAQSLTGALGKPIQTMAIPPVGAKSGASKPMKKHPIKKSQKMTSKQRTLLKVQDDKQAKKDADDSEWWIGKTGKLVGLQRLNLEAQIQETDLLLRNPRLSGGWLSAEVHLFRLNLELRTWINHAERNVPAIKDRFRISILRMIKEQAGRATTTSVSTLTAVIDAVGFSSMTTSMLGEGVALLPDRKLTFDFVKVLRKSGSPVHSFMKLDEQPTHWLLRCFGEYMDRSLESEPDNRVQFEPDGWQRRVLNSLDEDLSILVVAPTSAGKTFISYYAMERVLRSSDDGILVYIAPTKALVTQIAAEVSTRFKKDIDSRSCWAIHTRDYRIHDPQKCQILITVPEVFAIMLFSPPLARVWTPRLKRIILDEIHSIGQQEGGSVWEQILLMAPCPIIGLSATVGDPERFNDWLSSVQAAHNFKHTFIYHQHRYSHLRKYFYLQSTTPRDFTGLSNSNQTGRLRFLHPVSLLASGMARVIPPDFALEARDCLSLFEALKKQVDECGTLQEDIAGLHPSSFFPPDKFLKQSHILLYEASLKKILSKLIDMPRSDEPHSALQAVVRHLTDPAIAETPDTLLTIPPQREMLENDLIHLVSDLYAEGDLPALIFSFDRHQCETQAEQLLHHLESAEAEWRETSSEWQRKLKAWERYQSNAKERDRAKERSRKQRQEEESATPEKNIAWEERFDPSDPSPRFSFAGMKTAYDKSSLDSDLKGLSWTSTPDWALKAIKRGIAVHHSGMNKRYRNLVEELFRIGFLRVVIATATLALGINAPCRTVIFCGDSTYLTALQYRQAAGRAGRRGFDLLGKVIFYGLAFDRVQRLVLSRLPPIAGQFPLSTTLCLRLFNLLAGSQNADYAVKAVSAILSLPHISVGSETGQHELLHHLRFSIDYLLRAHLLNPDGQPLNLTGIATHLYYHEPNNLAFVALLRSGVIHNICNQSSRTAARRELMHVLCYLFGRRRLPRAALNEETLRPLMKRYPSMIVLPPLHQDVRRVLTEHATLTLRIFTGYAWTYASQNVSQLGPDDTLPLSDAKFIPSSHKESAFLSNLRSTALAFVVRSAFVATSGHTDFFATIDELCHEARSGLHLNKNAIPSMDAILADVESPFTLNAYLLDFFIHGQVESLVRANGIRRGDVWFLLQDFVLTLMAIKTSLQELLKKASKQDNPPENEEDVPTDVSLDNVQDPDMDDEEITDNDDFPRPLGADHADWMVYEIFSSLLEEFDAKFHKMWA